MKPFDLLSLPRDQAEAVMSVASNDDAGRVHLFRCLLEAMDEFAERMPADVATDVRAKLKQFSDTWDGLSEVTAREVDRIVADNPTTDQPRNH